MRLFYNLTGKNRSTAVSNTSLNNSFFDFVPSLRFKFEGN